MKTSHLLSGPRTGHSLCQRVGLVFALLCAALPLTAQETEEPAPTLAEAKADFAKRDKSLNVVWDAVKASQQLDAAELTALREDQKAWLGYRDGIALSPGYSGAPPDEAAAKKSPEYFSTAAALTAERTAWLKGRIATEHPETVTGVWSDSYGGSLSIVQQDGKLYFNLEVLRGPTAHIGSISGIASWNEPLGWFSDKAGEKDKTGEANVAFLRKGNRIDVHTANAGSYGGMRAYFDAEYWLVGKLNAKAQAGVIAQAKGEGSDP